MAVKQKERSELEWLRGELKRLKSENRNLRKQLKHSKREVSQYETLTDLNLDDAEIEQKIQDSIEDSKLKCAKCSSTQTKTIDLGARKVVICTECSSRKTIKS